MAKDPRIVLHIDMNSYFASVEQQANPFLRGKALGVCAYLSPRGCIIASSVEAKEVGVTVGMRVFEAQQIHPQIVLVENDTAKYRSTTRAIFSILQNYANELEPYSIDEAFLDLTGQVNDLSQAKSIAQEIQDRIKDEVGEWLCSSIGISSTRWLAKFASDITDNDNILILKKEDLPAIYDSVELTDAWGINTALEQRLNHLGIKNLNNLKDYPPSNLMQSMGKMGYYLWANVNGIELGGVNKPPAPKTIGHSYSLPKRTTDRGYHQNILMKLCERVGRRMRTNGLEARGISLYVGRRGADGFHKSRRVFHVLYDGWEIYSAANKIFKEASGKYSVTMLAVAVFRLQPYSGQLELFQRRREPRRLVKAMDKVNSKYGEFTVIRGRMWDTGDNAKERVGYRKTVSMRDLFKPPELEIKNEE
ncbi:hypothetical protein ACFL04_04960 [Patescibacteria group bacterium]